MDLILKEEDCEPVIAAALAEDVETVDATTVATVPVDAVARAEFTARERGVAAGIPVAMLVLARVSDGTVACEARVADGDVVEPGTVLFTATGPARALLTAERTALNLLCHLSGIATATRRWVDAVAGTGAAIRDTRKTTPGLRALEKYAVRCGGGVNHRMSLSDAALVKDNHVVAAGGVAAAFRAVREAFPALPVEVEVDTLDQLREVLDAGADLILLDNFTPALMREAVAIVGGRARLEASGRLALDAARVVAETGVDYLAVGALTHSAPILDIGCDFSERSNDAAGD
jgi:nicotinate-nucleotide pyrophosphorylase (carboxylating)